MLIDRYWNAGRSSTFAGLLLVAAGLNGACTGSAGMQTRPAPVEERAAGAVPVEPGSPGPNQPQAGVAGTPPAGAADARTAAAGRQQGPAVVALAAEAEQRVRNGETEGAAAALERALRLAPDDALLWQRLAQVRLRQGRWQQAIVLARKSSALAPADPGLRRENDRLIARAQQLSGATE